MGYEWSGMYFDYNIHTGNFVNIRTGTIMSPRRTCQFLNFIFDADYIPNNIRLYDEIEWRKEYQRHLESKIHILKKRVSELENLNNSLKKEVLCYG